MPPAAQRPRSTLLAILLLWAAFYASFTLFQPALLDDADSVHAEVAREMLLRRDPVTLYADGIRYLEKAPLLYWSMAASMRLAETLRLANPEATSGAPAGSAATSSPPLRPEILAAAARVPLAFTMLALALLCESWARALFRNPRAGLYAALLTLSSPGLFLFTRITIPDAAVCLWITLALYAFWRTESDPIPTARHTTLFAAACALNVLTKGLIGVVFPVGIVLIYLLATRGLRGTLRRLAQVPWIPTLAAFLLIAAPWHVLAGLATPPQGHPAPFRFTGGHWQVPLPTDANVRGWFWFYFMNEHVLRYLNLRVPRDYDTSPLWLFWGLCLVWLMPWSAYALAAAWRAVQRRAAFIHPAPQARAARNSRLLPLVWIAFVLLFFSLSTRQEYYVLPALPAIAILTAGWLNRLTDPPAAHGQPDRRLWLAATTFWLILGVLFTAGTAAFLLHSRPPSPQIDLATLLQQNPGDYALSMGHFLDLNAQALSLFRLPLTLAAASLLLGPLAALLLFLRSRQHAANLALAAGAFGFLLAAHLGLQTFAPVLSSAQLARTIAWQVHPDDLVVIHGEYEAASTLGLYLGRPSDYTTECPPLPTPATGPHLCAINPIAILEGRSSNLWYGSFFPDAPRLFLTPEALAAAWRSPQRVFLWQSVTDEPRTPPTLPGPMYTLAVSGGKEILSNQPNR